MKKNVVQTIDDIFFADIFGLSFNYSFYNFDSTFSLSTVAYDISLSSIYCSFIIIEDG